MNLFNKRIVKKSLKTFFSILFLFLIVQCGNKGSDSKMIIGRSYDFFDGVGEGKLYCNGCYSGWTMIVEDENIVTIYSYYIDPISFESDRGKMSCENKFKYKYDSDSGVFEILERVNKNSTNKSLDKFLGKWIWKKSENGERFYFEKMSGVDFHLKEY